MAIVHGQVVSGLPQVLRWRNPPYHSNRTLHAAPSGAATPEAGPGVRSGAAVAAVLGLDVMIPPQSRLRN